MAAKATKSTRGTKGTKGKRSGAELQMKLFRPKKARPYLVFRTSDDKFHVFQEVEAKDAAKIFDPTIKQGHTNSVWKKLWDKQPAE